MSNYTKTTDFGAKDALLTGNPSKIVRGSEIDDEFDNIATAVATKANTASPTFTGTLTAASVTATGTITFTGATVADLGTVTTADFTAISIGGTAITATADEINALDGLTATVDELNYNDITTLGTAEASKTITVSATPDIDFNNIDMLNVDINSGAIDGTTVGASSASTGAFTTLSASGAATFSGSVTFNGEVVEETGTMPAGTTPAIDPTNGVIQEWTLTGNSSPTDSLADGEYVTLLIDDGTAYTITWPTMEWIGGAAPTLDTTNTTVVELWKVGTTLYGALVGIAS